jgi:hypothetical protein
MKIFALNKEEPAARNLMDFYDKIRQL